MLILTQSVSSCLIRVYFNVSRLTLYIKKAMAGFLYLPGPLMFDNCALLSPYSHQCTWLGLIFTDDLVWFSHQPGKSFKALASLLESHVLPTPNHISLIYGWEGQQPCYTTWLGKLLLYCKRPEGCCQNV